MWTVIENMGSDDGRGSAYNRFQGSSRPPAAVGGGYLPLCGVVGAQLDPSYGEVSAFDGYNWRWIRLRWLHGVDGRSHIPRGITSRAVSGLDPALPGLLVPVLTIVADCVLG